jgi:hypothetical protein
VSRINAEVYGAFSAAGVDDARVRAAASAIPFAGDFATRADRAEWKAELRAGMAAVKGDLTVLKFVYGPIVIALLLKLVFFP